MVTLEQVTEFFGWCAFINIVVLCTTTVLLLALKGKVLPLHAKMFDIPESKCSVLYFSYLSNYKVITLTFFVVPYLALKLLG
ncbi:hypothetical protein BIW53_13090 [Pseudoalteromonas byunsanensis]|uniref:DUF6868 domain-containing protein n=2 Tax=Pseudoalteromonas byunsanensis TaxID=327939 RepID=A0A1S1N667_9GAMM|nr:hypothetical protein BIW53_13090 [Pseudoalteromonas byunsanensis]